MRIGKANISCGAFGQPSVPLSLSRRAHLLTTDKIGGVLPAAVVRSTRLCVGATRQYFNYCYTRKEVIAYRHIPS